ncbi:MAG: DUF349 domain-containing protein [Dysgonamonadaceae bacterium]|jgi:hypothetical protein|nr:DUF349 domain-containing protein [Dysgonamonadaceae bacterium]
MISKVAEEEKNPVVSETILKETSAAFNEEIAEKELQTGAEPQEDIVRDLHQKTIEPGNTEQKTKPAANHEPDKTTILTKLSELVFHEISDTVKNEVESLKQAFYRLKNAETEEARNAFIQEGSAAENFHPQTDEAENRLKELLAIFRQKKAALSSKKEKIQEDNLKTKKTIIEQLKALTESNDDFFKISNEFHALQQKWKEIRHVPQSAENDLWKEYQLYCEKFYDLLKINIEMRDYDFKKNLELKQQLCEIVEKLAEEKDAITAFFDLQKLHQEWRETGPVAKELREEIWTRFKKASSVINRKYQGHFESLRETEKRNLAEKTACCEDLEKIDCTALKTFNEWDRKMKEILAIQEKWKTIGFAPKNRNVKIFERFRIACDVFFKAKAAYYKKIKSEFDVNLKKKRALCEKAEALKDSKEWKETTDKMIELQKEWKTIGLVPRKHSDAVWKRFSTACDYFFEQKNANFSSHNSEEDKNLKKKKYIIAKIKNIDITFSTEKSTEKIRSLMSEWNKVSKFTTLQDKDKLEKEYRAALDRFKLFSERDELMRTYECMKNDIQTYENNIGFLSISSKGGGGLVKEMTVKIQNLKDELELLVKRIEVIDENF